VVVVLVLYLLVVMEEMLLQTLLAQLAQAVQAEVVGLVVQEDLVLLLQVVQEALDVF
jgi:hypothetical protein